MTRELLPYDLTWPDVDPARHPFSAEEALDVVRSLEAAGRVPVPPPRTRTRDYDEMVAESSRHIRWAHSEGWDWVRDLTRQLVERYGSWATGWRWSHDEGDLSGGPVGGWCCASHSISTPEETLARVARSLCEWREWLEFLARRFEAYPLGTLPVEDRRNAWDRATHHLILQSLDRTGSGDAWYGHCAQVLTWFLTRWDVPPETAETLVEEAVGGRFESWTAPKGTLVDDVAEHLATALEPDPGAPVLRDADGYRYTSARVQAYLDE
ncbi:hypothetical protein ABZ896_01180 [Streptomyces sp. NPDC047072]|uniref:hypothetical protein n=1 Tax=Streptomyces sp. NPDC047072 TaxID=3154809 RepID=UPI0033EEABFD